MHLCIGSLLHFLESSLPGTVCVANSIVVHQGLWTTDGGNSILTPGCTLTTIHRPDRLQHPIVREVIVKVGQFSSVFPCYPRGVSDDRLLSFKLWGRFLLGPGMHIAQLDLNILPLGSLAIRALVYHMIVCHM